MSKHLFRVLTYDLHSEIPATSKNGQLVSCREHGAVHIWGASAFDEPANLAPATVDYLVGTATGDLSAEIAVGTTPGGELGNTWASPTVDTTHSGSSHAGVVTTHEAAADPHTGYLRESMVKTVLSADFAIDAIAVVTVTTAHGLSVTPDIQDVQLTVSESTDVDDFVLGYVKVESVDGTNVVAKVNVTVASLTASAKAKLNILVVAGV